MRNIVIFILIALYGVDTLVAQDTIKSKDTLGQQILLIYKIGSNEHVYNHVSGSYESTGSNPGGLIGFTYGKSSVNELGATYGKLIKYIESDRKALRILKRARFCSTISLCSWGGIAAGAGIFFILNTMDFVPLAAGIAGSSLIIGIVTKIMARHGLKKSIKTYNRNLGYGDKFKEYREVVL